MKTRHWWIHFGTYNSGNYSPYFMAKRHQIPGTTLGWITLVLPIPGLGNLYIYHTPCGGF